MARQKKDKVDLEGVLVSVVNGKLTLTNEELGEIAEQDLLSRICSLGDKYGSLSVLVKDYNPRPVNRAPIFTYACKNCGKEIKSKVEDLHATCKDCDSEFTYK